MVGHVQSPVSLQTRWAAACTESALELLAVTAGRRENLQRVDEFPRGHRGPTDAGPQAFAQQEREVEFEAWRGMGVCGYSIS